MTPANSDLLVERQGGVIFATFNRPDARNALNSAIIEGLFSLVEALRTDPSARALVLRGAGGTFCAGGDVKEFAKLLMAPDPTPGAPDPAYESNRRFGDLLLAIDALPQVVIAIVEGAAFGGAIGLISIADVSIANRDARFSLSETTLGLVPAQIGPFIVRKLGLMAARRLALTGSRFGAEEALSLGFIDRLASQDGLDAELNTVLTQVLRCEPRAVGATKDLFSRSATTISAGLLDDAARDFAVALRGAGRLGAAAFASKSEAPWVEIWEPIGGAKL